MIYPRFQLTLIVSSAVMMIIAFAFTLFQAGRVFDRFAQIGETIQLPPDHPFFQLVEFQSQTLYSSLALAFLMAISTTCLVTLVLSQRLAGPIVRLKKYLSQIASDRCVKTQLRFRKDDYFEDLPAVVNEAFAALSKKT